MTALPRQSALENHCRALADCRRCGYSSEVAPILSHAASPRVMLVGQAPGQAESAGGRPFAGRAGKTLFRWLARAGIDEDTARRQIYIAAVTRCYPGPHPNGRGDRVPSRSEQAACSEWLAAELALIRPRLLIPVGRLAIMRFLPVVSLDLLIGGAHEVTYTAGGLTVIPLPHPSGASSWIHQAGHAELLEQALIVLGRIWRQLHIGKEPARQGAV